MSSPGVILKNHAPDASVHLDAIRGVAALVVFLGHGRGLFLKSGFHDAIIAKPKETGAPNTTIAVPTSSVPEVPRTTVGHQAVIVFFVMSGYFVGGSAIRAVRKGVFSWNRYLLQRLSRLWVPLLPALLLGLALDFAGTHLLHSPYNIYSGPAGQADISANVPSRIVPSVFLGNLFFLQGIAVPVFGTNVSLWSLCYEFWYYIFFPLLLFVCLASTRITTRLISLVLLVATLVFCGWLIDAYFVLWLFGAGVALTPLAIPSSSRKLVTWSLGLLLLVAFFLELKNPINLLLSDAMLGVIFSAFLWALLHAEERTVGKHYRSAAQGLSNMSYTLYLTHMPIMVLIAAILMPVWQAWELSARALLSLSAIYLFVFAICWLMYFCFERNTYKVRDAVAGILLRTS